MIRNLVSVVLGIIFFFLVGTGLSWMFSILFGTEFRDIQNSPIWILYGVVLTPFICMTVDNYWKN
jgi:uncharacterized iron-regulated membrane protein